MTSRPRLLLDHTGQYACDGRDDGAAISLVMEIDIPSLIKKIIDKEEPIITSDLKLILVRSAIPDYFSTDILFRI